MQIVYQTNTAICIKLALVVVDPYLSHIIPEFTNNATEMK